VAITFDRLNTVDSRSGEFKMVQIQKIDRVRAPRGHHERPALRRRFSGSSAMRLQSMIGNTALSIARLPAYRLHRPTSTIPRRLTRRIGHGRGAPSPRMGWINLSESGGVGSLDSLSVG
jgi:hypothetical protein